MIPYHHQRGNCLEIVCDVMVDDFDPPGLTLLIFPTDIPPAFF
jgi:hypothetical protein